MAGSKNIDTLLIDPEFSKFKSPPNIFNARIKNHRILHEYLKIVNYKKNSVKTTCFMQKQNFSN